MAGPNTPGDSGISTHVGDSQVPFGVQSASVAGYSGDAQMASAYGVNTADSYLPTCSIVANQTNDTQTLTNFETANNSFSGITGNYASALQDLSSGSPNAVADLVNLYGSLTQSDGQLTNAQNSQSSTFTNDSQLQSQLTGSGSVHNDVSYDQSQVLQALTQAAQGNGSAAINTLTSDFQHFSTDTQQDVSAIGNMVGMDYNALYGLNSGAGGGGDVSAGGTTGGGGDTTTGGTTATGGDTATGGTTATGGDTTTGGTTATGSDTTTGGTTATGGDTTTGGTTATGSDTTTGGTTATGGDTTTGGTTAAGSDTTTGGTSDSGSTLPSYLNEGLNAQQQAGLNQINNGHPGEAHAESHLNDAFSDAQTALSDLENGGGSVAQISKAINEAANNDRAARNGFYSSLTNNGIARHPVNPDDPINKGLNQYPTADRQFELAQDALLAGNTSAAEVAVTSALQDLANGNDSVLTGLGQELGVSAS